MQMADPIFLTVEASLVDFVEPALTRLRYTHATIEWRFDAPTRNVIASGADATHWPELQRDLNYQIYREKILSETAPIRRRLYEAL
jgi:hypothetical protein